MRYINDNANVKPNGRKAAKITEDQLAKFILDKAILSPGAMEDVLDGMDATWYKGCKETEFLQLVTALMSDYRIQKDNKFMADAENVLGHNYEQPKEDIGTNLMGIHTLKNGLTFFGFAIGNDAALPMFMVVYYDGKALRLYTPSCGNLINLDFKCPLGNEYADQDDIKHCKLLRKYKELGLITNEEDEEDFWDEPFIAYISQFGIPVVDFYDGAIPYNWDAIKTDIENHIVVV